MEQEASRPRVVSRSPARPFMQVLQYFKEHSSKEKLLQALFTGECAPPFIRLTVGGKPALLNEVPIVLTFRGTYETVQVWESGQVRRAEASMFAVARASADCALERAVSPEQFCDEFRHTLFSGLQDDDRRGFHVMGFLDPKQVFDTVPAT